MKSEFDMLERCPGECGCMVHPYGAEYPELYDGVIEFVCPKCKTRWGRWSGKILKEGEHEDPKLRFKLK